MHRLYFSLGSCSLASLIALEESGLPYEPVRLDFSKQEQLSPAFLAVNPKGRVPALETPRGVLTETPAILAYIAQMRPQAGLAPLDDPFAFATLQAFNGYLSSSVHVAHAHKLRGARWADEESSFADMRRKVPQSMAAAFQPIEELYLLGPWVMGEAYSLADGYLYTIARWLEGDGVDPATLPRVADHMARMAARPAVRRALAVERGEA